MTSGITELLIAFTEVFDLPIRWKVQYYYYYYYGGENTPIPLSFFNLAHLLLAFFMTLNLKRFSKTSAYFPYFLGAYIYGLSMYFMFIDFRILAARFIETSSLLHLTILLPICVASYDGKKRALALGLVYAYSLMIFYKNLEYVAPYKLFFL
jgi:hypothetical protein